MATGEPPSRGRGQSGFTVIELMAAIVFVTITLFVGLRAVMVTDAVTRTSVLSSQLEQRLHRALEQLTRELVQARADTLDPTPEQPLGASTLTYRRAQIELDGSIVWSDPRRVELVAASDDPEDGVDNDGDGLVDEREIWLVRDADLPTEQRSILARGVASFLQGEIENVADDNDNELQDERGLSFELRDEMLLIRLTMQAKVAAGLVVSRTGMTAVRVRN